MDRGQHDMEKKGHEAALDDYDDEKSQGKQPVGDQQQDQVEGREKIVG